MLSAFVQVGSVPRLESKFFLPNLGNFEYFRKKFVWPASFILSSNKDKKAQFYQNLNFGL